MIGFGKYPAVLPQLLEEIAEQIRSDIADVDNARAMSEYQFSAYALLTIGKAAGALSRQDVQRYVVDALRLGTLNPGYLVALRDQLGEVLQLAGVEGGTASEPKPEESKP